MNSLTIIVFDFETTGLDFEKNDVIQVAGKAYTPNLEPVPLDEGGEFESMMRPVNWDDISQKALDVNGKTREMLEAAPDPKVVWNNFVDWVKQFNSKGNKWTAPIAAGKNIRGFDLKFVDKMNKAYCPAKERTMLFNARREIDLEDFLFSWFEGSNELRDEKMDTVREYFGISGEGAHDALKDVRDTGLLIMKFLNLHRRLSRMKRPDGSKSIQFRGSCLAS